MFRTRGEVRKPNAARRMGRSPVEIPRKFNAGFARGELAAPPLKHPPKKSRQLRRLSLALSLAVVSSRNALTLGSSKESLFYR